MAVFALLAGAASAAVVSTLTPGPAFLSVLGIGASQGRRPAARFILGHLAGDILWSALAMMAIIGSAILGALAFELLGLVCAGYLFWIGCKTIQTRRSNIGQPGITGPRPLLRGVAFGLTNPKGYPVAIALFTTFLAGKGTLTWSILPALEGAAILGFLAADVLLVVLVGMTWIRRIFRRHEIAISRVCGVVFIGFAVEVALDSALGLFHRNGSPTATFSG